MRTFLIILSSLLLTGVVSAEESLIMNGVTENLSHDRIIALVGIISMVLAIFMARIDGNYKVFYVSVLLAVLASAFSTPAIPYATAFTLLAVIFFASAIKVGKKKGAYLFSAVYLGVMAHVVSVS